MIGRGWMTTFTDMLMLLLTFLVFIIAISKFRQGEENSMIAPLPQAWQQERPKPNFVKGTAIELIKGLKTPRLPMPAQQILTEMAQISQSGTFEGVNLYYNESKISLFFPDNLTFLPGSSELDQQARTVLSALIKPLLSSPYRISIEGHTDNVTGGEQDNLQLSVVRALSVARIFYEEGLPLGRMSVSGYGPYRPVGDNEDILQRRLNRRVEVHIMINEDVF